MAAGYKNSGHFLYALRCSKLNNLCRFRTDPEGPTKLPRRLSPHAGGAGQYTEHQRFDWCPQVNKPGEHERREGLRDIACESGATPASPLSERIADQLTRTAA